MCTMYTFVPFNSQSTVRNVTLLSTKKKIGNRTLAIQNKRIVCAFYTHPGFSQHLDLHKTPLFVVSPDNVFRPGLLVSPRKPQWPALTHAPPMLLVDSFNFAPISLRLTWSVAHSRLSDIQLY